MQNPKRALYNSLRLYSQVDPTSVSAEEWQIADYRSVDSEELFAALLHFDIHFNRELFTAYAEHCDDPEQLTELLADSHTKTPQEEDYLYLVIFELWRRFLPEKRCLSLFCDELDNQVIQYEKTPEEHAEQVMDLLAQLHIILEEEVDNGEDPKEIFASIAENCAIDLETFLYDFITEQLDEGGDNFAEELIEHFAEFAQDSKWFDCLSTRLAIHTEIDHAQEMMNELIQLALKEKELVFNFEVINILVQEGDEKSFLHLVSQTFPLLVKEEDFIELLEHCEAYYHLVDKDEEVGGVKEIIEKRTDKDLESPFLQSDPDLHHLSTILNLPSIS